MSHRAPPRRAKARPGDGDRPKEASAERSVAPAETLDASMLPEPSAAPGTFAGRYTLLGELGRGGMGVVYRARDELLGEIVALKVLRSEGRDASLTRGRPGREASALARLQREVRLARRITDPHVARTHDLGTEQGAFYLTMELVEGRSLGERLAAGPLSPDEALVIGRGIAAGLAAAHRAGVVHRDLKPDNVLCGEGRVVVTDFGVARALRDEEQGIAGTPAYMAPEQLEGAPADESSDLYALGVVLYECLTGRLPFTGDTPLEVGLKRLTEAPAPLPSLPGVPRALVDVVRMLLSRDRSARPRSAAAVVEALDRATRGEEEDDEVARLFRTGQHQAVLAQTFDAGHAPLASEHTAYVVGSLALVGRLDEALALAGSLEDAGASPRLIVPVRFFALVGLCHGGRYAEAERFAKKNAPACRDPEPRTRFFAFQGLALLRYFTGAVGRARLAAKRALKEAVLAHFAYGRLLALDLSGHVLVQRGEVSAGLRVLEQAEKLAASLGADAHRVAIECARLAYQNRHGRAEADLERALSQVAVTSVDNLYALRAAWLELAFRSVVVGDAERAREALDRARAQALPERDHRARARLHLVEAILARVDRSTADVRAALEQAKAALARAGDLVLEAELRVWDRVLLAGCAPTDRAHAAALVRRTGTLIARVLAALVEGDALPPELEAETPLFAVLVKHDAASCARLALSRGWLGLVPLLCAPEPGRFVFFLGDMLLAASFGTVPSPARMPGHAVEILRALEAGPRSKEELVREVWRVPRYAPQLHDPVVHTAIARLRRTLGPAADWLETQADGYALAPDVRLVTLPGAPRRASELPPEHKERTERAERRPERPRTSERPAADPIVEVLSRAPLAIGPLAEALRVSEATALRRLRVLLQDGRVIRDGVGKRTRYRLPS